RRRRGPRRSWNSRSRRAPVTSVTSLLHLVLYVYSIIVFVAVILSWFHLDPRHPIVRFTAALTEPVLRPIRKVLPPVAGLDLSPLLLLLGLQLLRRLLGIGTRLGRARLAGARLAGRRVGR